MSDTVRLIELFPISICETMPNGTVSFVSPRRGEDHIIPGLGIVRVWESDEEWGKRCAMLTNVGTVLE